MHSSVVAPRPPSPPTAPQTILNSVPYAITQQTHAAHTSRSQASVYKTRPRPQDKLFPKHPDHPQAGPPASTQTPTSSPNQPTPGRRPAQPPRPLEATGARKRVASKWVEAVCPHVSDTFLDRLAYRHLFEFPATSRKAQDRLYFICL